MLKYGLNKANLVSLISPYPSQVIIMPLTTLVHSQAFGPDFPISDDDGEEYNTENPVKAAIRGNDYYLSKVITIETSSIAELLDNLETEHRVILQVDNKNQSIDRVRLRECKNVMEQFVVAWLKRIEPTATTYENYISVFGTVDKSSILAIPVSADVDKLMSYTTTSSAIRVLDKIRQAAAATLSKQIANLENDNSLDFLEKHTEKNKIINAAKQEDLFNKNLTNWPGLFNRRMSDNLTQKYFKGEPISDTFAIPQLFVF
jgi:hypothetical protein